MAEEKEGQQRGARRALLVGVQEYDADDITDLPTIPEDVRRLGRVLELSGYEVSTTGHRLSPNEIRGTVARFVGAPEAKDQTLLIYLSGHGMARNGKDYLIPSDVPSLSAVLAEPDQTLYEIDPAGMAEQSPAQTVVLIVDACRETLSAGEKAVLRGLGTEAAQRTSRKLITIFGCEPTEVCLYDDELGASLLAEALCRVLDPAHAATTVIDLISSVNQELAALVDEFKPGRSQRLHYQLTQGAEESIFPVSLCIGQGERWCEDARGASLWKRAEPSASPSLRAAVEKLAATAFGHRRLAWQHDSLDPFDDVEYPGRVLARLDQLLPLDVRLSAVEIACLVAAPFVRESVLALARRTLAGADPLAPVSPEELSADAERNLEAIRHAHGRLVGLSSSVEVAQREAIASLLRHRAAFRDVRAWRDDVALECIKPLAAVLEVPDRHVEVARALADLALQAGAAADELEPNDDTDRPRPRHVFEVHGPDPQRPELSRIRMQALGLLLALAGSAALDVRQIGDVFPAHLAPSEGLSPDAATAFARSIRWVPSEDGLVLRMVARCAHPALHLMAEEHAHRLGEVLAVVLGQRSELPATSAALFAALPRIVSTDDVEAALGADGKPLYEEPLLRFRLAHDEVRELLMGVRLYGDPSLAVRELYQNALDACRYRQVRARYRGEGYSGKIDFVQGEESGRPYIECRDNGVGMGVFELENVFSRAGRRFVHTPEYLWEQAKWAERDSSLRLWPNSRFGIGVFSYFMLADEIEIWTARSDRETGWAKEELHVTISSSGSLFRLRRLPVAPERAKGGTAIRLFLRAGSESAGVSALEVLRRLLRYSDFEVTCEEGDDRERWPGGELRVPGMANAAVVRAGDHVWFADEGGLLADGLLTNQRRRGFFVNLAQNQQGVLSVDRQRLETWDGAWVREALAAGAEVVAAGPLTFEWLWAFVDDQPELARPVVDRFVGRRFRLPLGIGDTRTVGVDEIGAFPPDRYVPRDADGSRHYAPVFRAEDPAWNRLYAARVRVLADAAPGQISPTHNVVAVPATAPSEPVLDPLDSFLIGDVGARAQRSSADGTHWAVRVLAASARFGIGVATVLRHRRRHVVYGFEVGGRGRSGHDPHADGRVVDIATRLFQGTPVGPGWPVAALLDLAVTTGTTVRRLLADFEPYIDAGLPEPSFALECFGSLADRLPTETEMLFLGRPETWRSAAAIFVANELEPTDVTLDDVTAWHGFAGVERAALERVLMGDDLPFLSEELDASGPWLLGEIHPSHIVWVAQMTGLTSEDVLAIMSPYAEAGNFVLPDAIPDDTLPVAPEDWDSPEPDPDADYPTRVLLSEDADGQEPWGAPEDITPEHVLHVSVVLGETPAETLARLDGLLPTGVERPEVSESILSERLSRLQGNLCETLATDRDALRAPLTYAQLAFDAGHDLATVVHEALVLGEQFPGAPGLGAEDLESFRGYQPERADIAALAHPRTSAPLRGPLDRLILLYAAVRLGVPLGEAYDRLARFAPLGIEMPATTSDEWRQTTPRWSDFILLSAEFDGWGACSDEQLCPERLEAAAELTGASVDALRSRLEAYRGLFAVTC